MTCQHWTGTEYAKATLHAGCPWCRLDELRAEVQRLQHALAFWLPGVPANGPESVCQRIGDDAHLLAGYEGPEEPDAETLGWIRLSQPQPAPKSE